MAQVMRYYEHPNNYAWGAMPAAIGTATTAAFMSDIHDEINNTYSTEPLYSCDATGVYTSSNMGTILKNDFDYSSATYTSYVYSSVKNNINANRPVILAGSGSGGHMWVADGYRTFTYYYSDCTGVTLTSMFHMNWGWNGQNNGYYGNGNWNPNGSNYNSNRRMIYNIIP